MAAMLEQLVKVRSQFAEDLIAYLKAMEEELAKNPLLDRFGRKLDNLRVPLRVLPFEPVRDIEEIRARERFRQTGFSSDADEDKAARRVWRFRGTHVEDDEPKAARPRPEPLADLEPKLEMAVILGDPGSGKTEWLKYRARLVAQQTHKDLKEFKRGMDDLCFPAFLRLDDLERALADEGTLRDLLVETGCVPSRLNALSDSERTAAAILKTLIEHHKLSRRLASWVWKRLTARREDRAEQTTTDDTNAPPPLLLCLDAWDEVRSGQAALARCLNAFAQTTQARIFLTSRIIGYSNRPLPVENIARGKRRELQICPFEWSETEKFVREFFGEDARGQQMIAELRGKIAVAGMAQNPLLATLLCMAFSPNRERPPLGFPARRVEVYERVLEGLLGEWEATDKGVESPKGLIAAKLRLLEEMAYHFFPDEELNGDRLDDFLWKSESGYMRKLDDLDPLRQMLRQMLRHNHPWGIIQRWSSRSLRWCEVAQLFVSAPDVSGISDRLCLGAAGQQ